MEKENFEGYIISTDLGCPEKAIDLLCENLDLSTEVIKSNIHYSYRETHPCEVCHTAHFELYSFNDEEWGKLFNQQIANELREIYRIQTVGVGICYSCKKWQITFSRNERKYG